MPDYKNELNKAQYEAVTSPPGNTLVVAGAGTGKTRAIVYRLAWLAEQGIPPEAILLLTFTRKAANEMLQRAAALLGYGLGGLTGGTFHSFAFGALRAYRPAWLEGRPFTLMDSADISQAVKSCRDAIKGSKKDSTFPKTQTIVGLLGKARNKELPIAEILRQESFHLLPHAQALEEIGEAYASFRRERGLMDYDDLLFELEALLKENEFAAAALRSRFEHILVDEYQDTNLVQARIVRLLAQPAHADMAAASVMAVGDEAQSIYAFRGANVRNILDFPRQFEDCRIIRLEQNYRSTQPILNIANGILAGATESFKKNLTAVKPGGDLPLLVRPLSDASEAVIVTRRIEELLAIHRPHEIAVLFRAGFHSYPLENALRKAGIAFRKYGGLRFVEAAHIKDVLSFARLAINPLDYSAFGRIALMHKGIGPKTMASLHVALLSPDIKVREKAFKRFAGFQEDLNFIETLKNRNLKPAQFLEALLEYYRPRLESLYPDDWPSRLQGLEEILFMSNQYDSLDVFLAEMALDSPDAENEADAENCITLSTVHSAKGLEWNAVIILDAVEERFPSRHAIARPEDFEEERRLFYVACTRPRQSLDICAPAALYGHGGGNIVAQSPFLRELSPKLFENRTETYGGLTTVAPAARSDRQPAADFEKDDLEFKRKSGVFGSSSVAGSNLKKADCKSGYCRHRIFGRGKIVQHLDEDRVRVNFPGFGLKVILAEYLLPEE